MLDFNFTSIVNLVGFIVLAYSLWVMLYKPFFEIIDKRRQIVESELNQSEKLRKEAEEKLQKANKELDEIKMKKENIIKEAEELAKSIISNAKEDANMEKSRIIAAAEKEAKEIKEEAYKDIQSKVVSLSISIASMILKKNIDEKVNEEIVKKAFESLNKGENL
ncbi:F-type H+-transporting ATPase subunit b [Marinitoga hydrogenitolerans DSM 16785]|uniref:ATP synthase subunit b n=1 Tax=Marinitoga hydrogenitolerans (strain DSM 16785 / JCM 12826 / AT1271) TaxID=1122195 RepID=A0A1M4S7R8_MARH1|nr:F0F1 ATP synthase subunit B [Marinitoga hydrogenitolerans]SHE28230.1 F-type H+-transporting ATPase subunit b [Marinitoga hydrogenitolerans DSM 16785]